MKWMMEWIPWALVVLWLIGLTWVLRTVILAVAILITAEQEQEKRRNGTKNG